MIRKQAFYTLLLLFMGIAHISFAQVNGNKNMETKTYDFTNISTFDMQIPAKVIIDAGQDADFTITTDDNIFENLSIQNAGGKVKIDQATWIEPSQMVITFGSKAFTKLITSGYGNVEVNNIYTKNFTVVNPVGTVKLQGKAEKLKLTANTGKIDAVDFVVEEADVNISSFGQATLNVRTQLSANSPNGGEITYAGEPTVSKTAKSDFVKSFSDLEREEAKIPVEYVKVKVKNNKASRSQFYIQGPRHRRFSYGFPMNPLQVREKNVPIGTRIYKVNKFGVKTLLITIKAEDAGKVVKLFEAK